LDLLIELAIFIGLKGLELKIKLFWILKLILTATENSNGISGSIVYNLKLLM
jgi:hypothetical protein